MVAFCPRGLLLALWLAVRSSALEIFFLYLKEELSCFHNNTVFVPANYNSYMAQADMVVLMELARRPSSADKAANADCACPDFEDCDMHGGLMPDIQLGSWLTANHPRELNLVQIEQYSWESDDPAQSLLSIWYDPSMVTPGDALAYHNIHNATGLCTAVKAAKTGGVSVTSDQPPANCPAYSDAWWRYVGSKASLATSWTPADGSDRFAVLGVNLPSKYFKGKNGMLQRVMQDTTSMLGVEAERVFIIGDVNTRVLNTAYDACADTACHQPADLNQAIELAEQGWEIVPGRTEEEDDIEPCAQVSAWADTSACEAALDAMHACRRQCVAEMVCGSIPEAAATLPDQDPKRSTSHGLDLLPQYFVFPADRIVDPVDSSWDGRQRRPTYKRLMNEDVDACAGNAPFLATCSSNPCLQSMGSATCVASQAQCFEESAEAKTDKLLTDDPLYATAPAMFKTAFVSPSLGYLDSFGYSHGIAGAVTVGLFIDLPDLTFGDHGAFAAAVTFSTSIQGSGASEAFSAVLVCAAALGALLA